MRILSFISLLLLGTVLWAEERDPLIFYVNDQKPWGYVEDGELKGVSVTFVKLLGKAVSHPVTIEMAPYHRLLKDFEAGRMDFTMFLEDQKPNGAVPVARLLDVDIVAVGMPGFKIEKLSDLDGLQVGKIRGAMYSQKLVDGAQFDCVEVHSYQQAVDLLRRGRLDAVVGTPMALRYALHEMDLDSDALGEPYTLDTKTAWLYASDKSQHQDKIEPVRQTIHRFTKNQVIQKLAATIMGWLR